MKGGIWLSVWVLIHGVIIGMIIGHNLTEGPEELPEMTTWALVDRALERMKIVKEPSFAAVQQAVNEAEEGDMVYIPRTTMVWTNTLVIDKGIWLHGGGSRLMDNRLPSERTRAMMITGRPGGSPIYVSRFIFDATGWQETLLRRFGMTAEEEADFFGLMPLERREFTSWDHEWQTFVPAWSRNQGVFLFGH